MKKILYIFIALLLFGTRVYALPSSSYQQNLIPFRDNAYELGTTSDQSGLSKVWLNIFGTNLSVSSTTIGNLTVGSFTATSTTATSTIAGNLQVNGLTQLGTGVVFPASIYTGFTTGSVLFAGTNGLLTQDNATFFWDDTNKRLGIGTASPQNSLHIVGVSAFRIERSGVGSVVFNNSNAMNGSVGGDLTIDPQQASTGFLFRPRNSSNTAVNGLGIDRNGNVGIGTTSPTQKLNVVLGFSNTGTSPTFDGNTVAVFRADTLTSTAAGISVIAGNAAVSYLNLGDSDTEAVGRIQYDNSINAMSFRTSASAKLTIDTDGDVGIGSTTPWGKLSVTQTGTGGAPSFIVEDIASPDTTPFIIDQAGNVGVGSTTPFGKFGIMGGANGTGPAFAVANPTRSLTEEILNISGNTAAMNFSMLSNGNIAIASTSQANPTKLYIETDTLGFRIFSSGVLNTSTIQAPTFVSPVSTVSLYISSGNGTSASESTSAYTASQSSGNIRFNGSGVAFGDFGYYPNGGGDGNFGNFRLSVTGSTIDTTPDAKLGVGSIYAAGNSGIGSTTPYGRLGVKSAGGAAGIAFAVGNVNDLALFNIVDNGKAGFGTSTPSYPFSVTGANTEFRYASISNFGQASVRGTAAGQFIAEANTAGIGGVLSTYNDGVSFMGFNRTNYTYLYHAGGNGMILGTTEADPIIFAPGATEKVRFTDSGLVGIASSTPTYPLSVDGSGVYVANIRNTSTGVNGGLLITDASGGVDSYGLKILTQTTTESFLVRNDGRVGIASSTPGARLSITGAGGSTGKTFETTNSSNVPMFTILDGGSIGIGTSSPTIPLSIAGLAEVKLGLSTSTARVGGSIFATSTDAGNQTTAETDILVANLKGTTMGTNNDRVEGYASGIFVSSGTATRQVKGYFGGTQCFDSGALSITGSSNWFALVKLIRVSSTVVRCSVTFSTSGASLGSYTGSAEVTGLNLSADQIWKFTGTAAGVGAATNDIVAKQGAMDWMPVPKN